MGWKSRETVTYWAQVRNNFTYLLRLAITHDCP